VGNLLRSRLGHTPVEVTRLGFGGGPLGVTLPQAAMAFPLRHPAVAGVVVGMRSPAEVQANVADFDTAVPSGLWSTLADEHLIDPRAA
jgi:D-threo-aldose 1-dehydrogenase